MTILTLDTAKYPTWTATFPKAGPADAGALTENTTYYYRIAVETSEGVTCAGPVGSFQATATKKILLSWGAVAGATAYRVYRYPANDGSGNTSWTGGTSYLTSVATTTYTDSGSPDVSTGQPLRFTSDNVRSLPEESSSTLPVLEIPGQEGGVVQYLGSPPKTFQVELSVIGASAIQALNGSGVATSPFTAGLRDIKAAGVPVTVTYLVSGQTWISDYYMISSFTWDLQPGTSNAAGGEFLHISIKLVEA